MKGCVYEQNGIFFITWSLEENVHFFSALYFLPWVIVYALLLRIEIEGSGGHRSVLCFGGCRCFRGAGIAQALATELFSS